MFFVYAVALTSAVVDGFLTGLALFGVPGPVGARRLSVAISISVFVFLAKALVLLVVLPGHSLFLLILLAFAYLALTLPGLGLVALLQTRRRKVRRPVLLLAWASLLGVPVAAWSFFGEPFRLVTEEVTVALPAGRSGSRPLRVGVLADLQARAVGAHERAAVARLMALAPDLILIPGDLAQVWPRGEEEAWLEFHELVAELDAPRGVFMVLGNTDDPAFVRRVLEGTRVRLLENERLEFQHEDMTVTLAGLGKSYGAPLARTAASRLEELPERGDVRILLAHYPDAVSLLSPGTRVDLLVAGHTHGGQVQLPWLGPPITLSNVPRHVAAGGLRELDGRRLYVSRGIGVERGWAPRLRLNCPPEVTLLTLAP